MQSNSTPLNRKVSCGFTLLELAVVVVIIALLVGGILSGRSFLANAELRAVMTEAQSLIGAFNQFHKIYKAYPGDYNPPFDLSATPPINERPWASAPGKPVYYGDGNGVIRTSPGSLSNRDDELFIAFQHLALAGLIPGNYTGATDVTGTVTSRMGTNIPESPMAGVGYLFNHPNNVAGDVAAGDPQYFPGKYGHVLWVGGQQPPAAESLSNRRFLSPIKTHALDDKFDDGMPGTGWFTARNNFANCTSSFVTTATYRNLTTQECYFFLNIPGS